MRGIRYMKRYMFGSSGQSLVEAVVVVGVVVLLVTGLVAGTTASLKSAQSGRIRSQAVSLAQEGIEIVRGIRDKNWNTFSAYDPDTYCLGEDQTLILRIGTCSPNITTPEGSFTRSVSFRWQNPTMIVTLLVSYIDAEVTKDVTLNTYFTQWK